MTHATTLGERGTRIGGPLPAGSPGRRLVLAAKALVSVGLLAILVRAVNWGEIAGMLRRASLPLLGVSVLTGIVLNALSAWKWGVLLAARGTPVPFPALLNLYFVGNFVNNFFPSTIGGDVVRGYEAGRRTGDAPTALAAVVVERFTGITALMAIAGASFLANVASSRDPRLAAVLGVGFGIYCAVVAAVALRSPLRWVRRLAPAGRAERLIGKLARLQEAVHGFTGHPRALLAAMGLSFLFHAAAMFNVWVSALAFGIALPARSVLVVVPVIMFITALPVSIGGFGLAEWAYFFSFGAGGAGGSPGVLVGLLMRAKSLAFSLYGGVLYAAQGMGKGAAGDG